MTTVRVLVPEDGSIVNIPNLELEERAVTVLFGPNGAGKTTVLRRLAGIGADHPLLQCVYQPQPAYLFRGLAGMNLGLGLGDEEAGMAGTLADRFGLRRVLAQPAEHLSGGERQRLALARSLSKRAEWVLLDEPLTGIDRQDRELVLEVLATALTGRSSLVVTHDLDVAAALGDKMAVMIGGEIVQQGPLKQVLRSPRSIEVARVTGLGNIIEGKAKAEAGLIVLRGDKITVVGVGTIEGAARALIPAEAVVLAWGDDRGTSARNHWSGTITRMTERASVLEVEVDVGEPVVALVTRGAAEELGLSVGSVVSVTVKATSVSVFPA
jgi:molybdate transport system ATP-binding protein